MNNKNIVIALRSRVNSIDWKLLLFLLLFLDVKLLVKFAAILMIFILRPNFKFGFRLKDPRLPLFYPLIIGIVLFNWIISGLISNINYDLAVVTGLAFWILCILAIHQVKLSVENNDPEIIHRTILVFFVINAIVSLAVYLGIIIETGHLNPYRYQGNFQKYFIGTGDYIKGISFDTSSTNAVLNAFGVIYFLKRKKNIMVLVCMIVLLLTGSNVTNLVMVLVLIYLFIFKTTKEQKSMIGVCLIILATFLLKISPQNNKYIKTLYQRLTKDIPREKPVYLNTTPITAMPDSILSADERKKKIAQLYLDSLNRVMIEQPVIVTTNITSPEPVKAEPVKPEVKFTEKPVIPKDSIHTPSFQHRSDTTATEKTLLNYIKNESAEVPIAASRKQNLHIPGKIFAIQQTLKYFQQHPLKLLTGLGIGNFSSKLAFRTTAMKIAGGYPEMYRYISREFKLNHLDLYLFYFTSPDDLHSVANNPNCTYDQLLGEYGIAGLVAFFIFYAGFFLRRLKYDSYGLPVLFLMLGMFFAEYWFEQLSVVVFFELLVILNIKESTVHEADRT